jgi:hypothetical protein
MYVQRNIEARSRNNCRGKVITNYYECASLFLS